MTDQQLDGSWKRMSFNGNKVWVEQASDGSFLTRSGKVRIKYNLNHNYDYWIRQENLKPEDAAQPTGKSMAASDKKTTKPRGPRSFMPKTESVPPDAIQVYTDGASSGNPGPSGIGIVLRYGSHEKEISEPIGIATNNIAELKAIQRALVEIKRRDLPVRLFTDSSYSIGVLTRAWKPEVNRTLIADVRSLMATFSDLKIIKVKGHDGIHGNERADTLATRGAASHS